MAQPVVALIVAEPGRLRDAWRALLVAVPGIGEVLMADDVQQALALVERHHPGLVLVDVDVRNGDTPAVVQRIKRLQPGVRCIVLTCCTGQESPAAAIDADAVLVKGFAAERLFETVSRVLGEREKPGF